MLTKRTLLRLGIGKWRLPTLVAAWVAILPILAACEPGPPGPSCPDDLSCACDCFYASCADGQLDCWEECDPDNSRCDMSPSLPSFDVQRCAYCGRADR